eukprot:scaffold15380_cov66-Skeletonema_marinoi.AAC.1
MELWPVRCAVGRGTWAAQKNSKNGKSIGGFRRTKQQQRASNKCLCSSPAAAIVKYHGGGRRWILTIGFEKLINGRSTIANL